MALDQLVEDPENARRHGQRNIAAIAASLRRFGQQKPIVVGQGNVVLAGNGTLGAARSLGWRTVDVVRSKLTAEQARAFAVADNRSAELAHWDYAVLDRLLRELDVEDLDAAGFDEADLDDLIPAELRQQNGVAQADSRGAWKDRRHRPIVKLVLDVPQVDVVEEAIACTGLQNRAEAIVTICTAFLRRPA